MATSRKVCLIFGIAAAGVVAVGLASWREVAVRYHMTLLRKDSGYLSQILDRPDGTLQGEAARRFIESADDASIFKVLLAELDRMGVLGSKMDGRFRIDPESGIRFQGDYVWMKASYSGSIAGPRSGLHWNISGMASSRLSLMQAILARHHFECKDPRGFPGAEFIFQDEPSWGPFFRVRHEGNIVR